MNPRPMACKATALATELYPQKHSTLARVYKERERRKRSGPFRVRAYALTRARLRERFVSRFGRSRNAATLRKEVIQPHLPVRLPCYDFTPLTRHTFGNALLTVRQLTSGTPNSGGVTGGVYKARERIHRIMLICDY